MSGLGRHSVVFWGFFWGGRGRGGILMWTKGQYPITCHVKRIKIKTESFLYSLQGDIERFSDEAAKKKTSMIWEL